jgi:hypothetical protein
MVRKFPFCHLYSPFPRPKSGSKHGFQNLSRAVLIASWSWKCREITENRCRIHQILILSIDLSGSQWRLDRSCDLWALYLYNFIYKKSRYQSPESDSGQVRGVTPACLLTQWPLDRSQWPLDRSCDLWALYLYIFIYKKSRYQSPEDRRIVSQILKQISANIKLLP